MKEYFHDRRQFVQFNQSSLALQNHMRRSALYSILGPLFFLFFVTDLCRVSRMMKLQLFADDANIFLLGKDHEHLIDSANFELSEIVTWLQANKFSLNIKKTNCMLSKTHKGLKRVTLICLLCPMLVIIYF